MNRAMIFCATGAINKKVRKAMSKTQSFHKINRRSENHNFETPNLVHGKVEKISFREDHNGHFSFEAEVVAVKDSEANNSDAYVIDDSYIGIPNLQEGFGESHCQIAKSFKIKWNEELACYTRAEPNEAVVIKISTTRNSALLNEIAAIQHLGKFRKNHFEVALRTDTVHHICISNDNEFFPEEASGSIFLVSAYYEDIEIPPNVGQQIRESHAQFIFYNMMNELCDLAAANVCHFGISLENVKRMPDASFILVGHGHAKKVSCGLKQDSEPTDNSREGMGRKRLRTQKNLKICEPIHLTPYMPPEIIFQQQNDPFFVDALAVDLWAAFVVLFSMLSRFIPGINPSNSPSLGYIAGTDPANLAKIIDELPTSGNVKNLLKMSFHKDPRKRPSLHEVLRHPWVAEASSFPLDIHSPIQPPFDDEDFQDVLRVIATNDGDNCEKIEDNSNDESVQEEKPEEVEALSGQTPGGKARILVYQEKDVLFGRGGVSNNHPGNIFWRGVCNEYLMQYIKTPKNDKKKVAEEIFLEMRNRNPGMLFLQKGRKEDDHWEIEDDEKVLRKIMQRLREKAKEARKQMGGSFEGTGIRKKIDPQEATITSEAEN